MMCSWNIITKIRKSYHPNILMFWKQCFLRKLHPCQTSCLVYFVNFYKYYVIGIAVLLGEQENKQKRPVNLFLGLQKKKKNVWYMPNLFCGLFITHSP